MRLMLLAPLALLAACGEVEEETVPEETVEATEIETPEPRDITAIDAATDYDAGLADEDVPGRDADNEE